MADRLFKHCKTEHVPQPGRMLRIGTLAGFRTIENQATRDSGEGRYTLTLRFDNSAPTTREWLYHATFGSWQVGFYGDVKKGEFSDNHMTSLFVGHRTDGPVSCTGSMQVNSVSENRYEASGELKGEFEGKDAFLFCLSTSSRKGSVIYDDAYDAMWSIEKRNLKAFMTRLARMIKCRVMEDEGLLDNTVPHSDFDYSRNARRIRKKGPAKVSINSYIYKVRYKPKSIELRGVGWEKIREIRKRLDESAFIKPPSFRNERETRIVFRVGCSNGKHYMMTPHYYRDIYVPCEPILDLIKIH